MEWHVFAIALLSFMLTILSINYRMDKKRYDDNAKECAVRDAGLAERLTRVEAELMTEREVRSVLKDYFEPFMHTLTIMQQDVQDIKVSMAQLQNKDK